MADTPISSQLNDLSSLGSSLNGETGGTTNTTSPFIINPGTGQFQSNPGFMNSLQQLEYKLQSDPAYAADLQNIQQLSSMVPTGDLINYRNPQNGTTPPIGTTYAELVDGGYQQINSAQQQQSLQAVNAQNNVTSAVNASNGISTGAVTLGDLLSHVSPALGNLIPGYSSYKQSLGGLQSNPLSTGATGIFGTAGVTPSTDQGSPLSAFEQNLRAILQGNNTGTVPQASTTTQAATRQAPIAASALQPSPSIPVSPYTATANPIISGAMLGAQARESQGIK